MFQDGRAVSATVAAATLCFCRLFDSSIPAVKLFASRRFPPAMTSSQQRYMPIATAVTTFVIILLISVYFNEY